MQRIQELQKQINGLPNNYARVAVCTLNQWAMDFELNKQNIIESIQIAKQNNCTIRVGPELEIPGFGCEDHFLEKDTVIHSWEVLGELLDSDLTNNILVTFGMPVIYKSAMLNCIIVCLNKQILLIRPKIYLADGGNYREPRFFSSWLQSGQQTDMFELPIEIQRITKQQTVPIGNIVIEAKDINIGIEICEELWTTIPTGQQLQLDGCGLIINSSGQYYQKGKQRTRNQLILDAVRKTGGIYLYANSRGCDGGRFLFDGNSMIVQDGKISKMSYLASLSEVEVVIADVDLTQVEQFRTTSKSFGQQSIAQGNLLRVQADIFIGQLNLLESNKQEFLSEQQYEEMLQKDMMYAPSCYLWDYLKRSGAIGFFLALSGGSDSAASAFIVYNMCQLVYEAIEEKKDAKVLNHLRIILQENNQYKPLSADEICQKLLFTGYMMSENSSSETKSRAKELSQCINCTHFELNINSVVKAYENIAQKTFNQKLRYQINGGQIQEDKCLQNIQARNRMILSYMMGGLIPWHQKKNGFLLVLANCNLNEQSLGYFTKYDNSSGDINVIGSLSKEEIIDYLKWNLKKNNNRFQILNKIINAKSTAELRPLSDSNAIVQFSEQDTGITYQEQQQFFQLRTIQGLGPVSMYKKLLKIWHQISPEAVAEKVKKIFYLQSSNRHKLTTLTPSFHQGAYSSEDNRYDLRQFLYNNSWTFQFNKIEDIKQKMIAKINKNLQNKK